MNVVKFIVLRNGRKYGWNEMVKDGERHRVISA